MAPLPPDPIYMMKGSMGPIHCLLFQNSAFFEHIYVGTESGSIHIWDLQKKREILVLDFSKDACFGLHFISHNCFVTQRKGGALNIWSAHNSSWNLNKTVQTNYFAYCRSQKLSNDALYVPLNESKIGLFSLKTHEIEIEFDPLSLRDVDKLGDVMAIKPVLDESNYVLAAYDVGKVLLFDIRQKKVVSSLTINASPMTMDFKTSEMGGVIGTSNENLVVFSLSDNHKLSERRVFPLKNPGVSIVNIRPDAKVYATGGWDSKIRIFSWKTDKPLAVLDSHSDTIHDIVYSANKIEAFNCKCLMAAAGKDGIISLWDLYNN